MDLAIITCSTLFICAIILSITIYKCINKLTNAVNKLEIKTIINKNIKHYPAEEIKQDNVSNIYESNIIESTLDMQSRVFNKPIYTSGEIHESNSDDDDIDKISQQLKGITNNGR